jgi:hypothetical protein
MKRTIARVALSVSLMAGLAAIGAPQIREIIKILGVGAAVRQFGPEINKQFNRITGHEDTAERATKTVPIITIGISSTSAIGAAQVMGPRRLVDQVQAVASPEATLFGKEIRIRAMIPVSSSDFRALADLKKVEGVGVSGIVDLKL